MREFIRKNPQIISIASVILTVVFIAIAINRGFSYKPPTQGEEIVPRPATEEDSFFEPKNLSKDIPKEKPKEVGFLIFVFLAGISALVAVSSAIFLILSHKKEKRVEVVRSARKEVLDEVASRLTVFYKMNGRLPEPKSNEFTEILKGIDPPIDFNPAVYNYENPNGSPNTFRLLCKLEEDYTKATEEKEYVLEQTL